MTLVLEASVEGSFGDAPDSPVTVSVNYRETTPGSERPSPVDPDRVPPLLAYAPALLTEFFTRGLTDGFRARIEASTQSRSGAGFPRTCDDAATLGEAIRDLREYAESGGSASIYPVTIWLFAPGPAEREVERYLADRGDRALFLALIEGGAIWTDLEDAYCDIMSSARNAPSVIEWMKAACRKAAGPVHCALELP